MTILAENKAYWTQRASSYSELSRAELSTHSRIRWLDTLDDAIRPYFSGRRAGGLRILEVGTGPGFFAIMLAQSGHRVTAVDLTPSMLEEAKKNAGPLAGSIRFMEMNAEELTFPPDAFDVVVSRNLTWNLPHPEDAYREWHRVLKPGGLLLNFDANWYSYLFSEAALAAYREDRRNTALRGVKDENIGENFDVMEGIARRCPLSRLKRPEWDRQVLESIGFQVAVNERIWERVWTDEEKINFRSTPMFLVSAVKKKQRIGMQASRRSFMSENKRQTDTGRPVAGESPGHGHKHDHAYAPTVTHRLSRAVGHLESVKKMVEEGHDCSEVLIQLAAVRGALASISRIILKEHMEHCVLEAINHGDQESLDELSRAIDKIL